ncbi:hypothetical protein C5616_25630 [Vibrio anguillarum]|nr:hypothetical protein [Vibrio anguillarum]
MTQSRLERLLSGALGYDVDLTPTRLTRRKRLENKLEKLEERLIARITKGRTKGAGAGGFNRDIDNISHQIQLVKIELGSLTAGMAK